MGEPGGHACFGKTTAVARGILEVLYLRTEGPGAEGPWSHRSQVIAGSWGTEEASECFRPWQGWSDVPSGHLVSPSQGLDSDLTQPAGPQHMACTGSLH